MNTSVETNVWGRILHSLKGRLNQQTLDTWFSPIQFESLDSSQHVIHLRAPNRSSKIGLSAITVRCSTESLNELRLVGIFGRLGHRKSAGLGSALKCSSICARRSGRVLPAMKRFAPITVTETSCSASSRTFAEFEIHLRKFCGWLVQSVCARCVAGGR